MAVYRRGETWWFKFAFRGIPIRESAHTKSRTEALRAERARKNQLDEGASPLKTVRPVLFSAAAKQYLELKAPHWQPATRASEGYNVRHLLPHFGRMLLTDIQPDDIARYQAKRSADGASGRTVNMEVGSLRAILRKHRLWANLEPDVKPLPARTDVGRALSKDEEGKLLQAARESQSRGLYVAILLSLRTGLRNRELRMLRWNMVDLVEGLLIVGVSKTQGGQGRIVPLSPIALAALREWRGNFLDVLPEHFVFRLSASVAPVPGAPATEWIPLVRSAHGRLRFTAPFENLESSAAGTTCVTLPRVVSVKGASRSRPCWHCADG